jgi:NADH:ubiquinone oxidoreductase subunit 5 (subunit L)/multisubunit Na+/H+ antiporter MnhA subunit
MFPLASETVGVPLMASLGVAGIIYGSLCALAQRDIKKLVAYSSVAHLGFCILGLFALNAAGISGGVLQMINHGLSTGALFLLVGMVYERYHTRMLDDLGGLAARLPLLACIMVFIAMSSIGLPGLNGFVGEVLSLAGMFRRHYVYAVLGATGVILGAWYLLTMVQYAFFGPLREPAQGDHAVHDINLREVCAVVPICALCLVIGVMPQPLLDLIRPDVDAVVSAYSQAMSDEDHVAGRMATPAAGTSVILSDAKNGARSVIEPDSGATGSHSALLAPGLWSTSALDGVHGPSASYRFRHSKHEAFTTSTIDSTFAEDRMRPVTDQARHWQSQWHPNAEARSRGDVGPSVAKPPSG